MNGTRYTDRRKVIKTIGAGIVGSVVLTGSASADGRQLPREAPDGRTVYATWGDDEIWEIFDAEPPSRWQDSEGDDNAHEPLYFIKAVPGAAHSPHFPGAGIDHTVPVPGGTDKQYSAQWHPKAVVDPDNPGPQNLVNQDQDGNYLTSSTKIENAADNDEVAILAGPEESVFTCPVRPHGHREGGN